VEDFGERPALLALAAVGRGGVGVGAYHRAVPQPAVRQDASCAFAERPRWQCLTEKWRLVTVA
jgi:hypothetical protein